MGSDNGMVKLLNGNTKWIAGMVFAFLLAVMGWAFALTGDLRDADVNSLNEKTIRNEQASRNNAAEISRLREEYAGIKSDLDHVNKNLDEIKRLLQDR